MAKRNYRYSNVGIRNRALRIFDRKTGKTVIVPMDHGISIGPVYGINQMDTTIDKLVAGGANAVVLHKGCVHEGARIDAETDIGLIVHLSASTSMSPNTNQKRLVCTVEEAVKLGADAVSMHINFGCKYEDDMLEQLGKVSAEAREWGMPLMVMAYPRGEEIEDSMKGKGKKEREKEMAKHITHAARAVFELGASIIKIPYTGDIESFRKIVQSCPVPIVIAGGPKMETDREVFQLVYDAIKAGASGTSIGRNIFQHESPEGIVRAISEIVHNGASVEEAMKILEPYKGIFKQFKNSEQTFVAPINLISREK